jgi:hypothetical protein
MLKELFSPGFATPIPSLLQRNLLNLVIETFYENRALKIVFGDDEDDDRGSGRINRFSNGLAAF